MCPQLCNKRPSVFTLSRVITSHEVNQPFTHPLLWGCWTKHFTAVSSCENEKSNLLRFVCVCDLSKPDRGQVGAIFVSLECPYALAQKLPIKWFWYIRRVFFRNWESIAKYVIFIGHVTPQNRVHLLNKGIDLSNKSRTTAVAIAVFAHIANVTDGHRTDGLTD